MGGFGKVIQVDFYKEKPQGISLTFVVIASRFQGKWLYVRHKERDTYEIPGGHIEFGEDYLVAANRELYEETGAKEFTLDLVSIYTVTKEEKTDGGYLFFADIQELSALPDYEIAETKLFDGLPKDLTYPLIQPYLFERTLEWATSKRLEWKVTPTDEVLTQNKSSWESIADDFFGVTALPTYGCLCPTEDELNLFPSLSGKVVLDIGCGSGHSLKWCGDKGASELWGLDLSTRQLENAKKYLMESGYSPRLFNSPMEHNPGLPECYYDVVYSIYAIGWSTNLQATFGLISSYLKQDGIFIFSWDHPFMHCVDEMDDKLIFSGSYHETEPFTFQKYGNPLTLNNRRLCDYINALSEVGFAVEKVIEETDKETLSRDVEFSSGYYTPTKAKRFPLSIIIKARKL